MAGCLDKRSGYFRIKINSIQLQAHRIVWALANEADPGDMFIDHIDRNKQNNDPINLRLATKRDNAYNQKNQSKLGPGIAKKSQKYEVRFVFTCSNQRKVVYCGGFSTLVEAQQVREEALDCLYSLGLGR